MTNFITRGPNFAVDVEAAAGPHRKLAVSFASLEVLLHNGG